MTNYDTVSLDPDCLLSAEQRDQKNDTGDQKDNASGQGERIFVFNSGGDKKNGTDDKQDPAGHVISFFFLGTHMSGFIRPCIRRQLQHAAQFRTFAGTPHNFDDFGRRNDIVLIEPANDIGGHFVI